MGPPRGDAHRHAHRWGLPQATAEQGYDTGSIGHTESMMVEETQVRVDKIDGGGGLLAQFRCVCVHVHEKSAFEVTQGGVGVG